MAIVSVSRETSAASSAAMALHCFVPVVNQKISNVGDPGECVGKDKDRILLMNTVDEQ